MKPKPILVVLLAALTLTGCSVQVRSEPTAGAPSPALASSEPLTIEQSDVSPPASKLSDVIARALPSVVNVRVRSVGDQRGEGSGVIISRNGIILTNNHVVSEASEVKVVFNDDEHEPMFGRVLGVAPDQDIAVIKVDADDLTPMPIARSSNIALGTEVIAIGYPLGLGGATVTRGIISGKGRDIEVQDPSNPLGSQTLEKVLQTDAAINPGNSGGALVDMRGQLVGINSAAAQAGAAENVGFAIAIDSAIPTVEHIVNTPVQQQPWLGVYLSDVGELTEEERAQLNADSGIEGAVLAAVVSGGPAEAAGLEIGDVITAIDGDAVPGAAELIEKLNTYSPGDAVSLTVATDDGTDAVEVTLGQRPPQFASSPSPSPEG
jgi:S1-C subfamily serine protease